MSSFATFSFLPFTFPLWVYFPDSSSSPTHPPPHPHAPTHPPPPLPEYLGSPACFSLTIHLPGQQLFIFSSPLLFKYGRTFSQTSEHTKGERDPNLDPPFHVPEPHLRTTMSAVKVSVLWAGYHGELKPCTSLMSICCEWLWSKRQCISTLRVFESVCRWRASIIYPWQDKMTPVGLRRQRFVGKFVFLGQRVGNGADLGRWCSWSWRVVSQET